MVTITYSSGSQSIINNNSLIVKIWRDGVEMSIRADQLQTGDYWAPISGQPPIKIDGSVVVS